MILAGYMAMADLVQKSMVLAVLESLTHGLGNSNEDDTWSNEYNT